MNVGGGDIGAGLGDVGPGMGEVGGRGGEEGVLLWTDQKCRYGIVSSDVSIGGKELGAGLGDVSPRMGEADAGWGGVGELLLGGGPTNQTSGYPGGVAMSLGVIVIVESELE